MKFLVVFVLALATASAFDLRGFAEIKDRSVFVPIEEQDENYQYNRITNGNEAKVGQFPYQVSLALKINAISSASCGGSMISPQWVVTAAHCVDTIQSVKIGYGSIKRTQPDVEVTVEKKEVIVHPGWNPNTLVNDIALIKTPFVGTTANIEPVKLPKISNTYATYAGDYGIASGFGKTSDSAGGASATLNWARLTFITNTACKMTYGNTVQPSNLCVSTAGGTSTCNGDSGGPIVLESDKVQVGLTSFGAAAGCEKGYYAVFTRITSYLDWIKQHTGIAY